MAKVSLRVYNREIESLIDQGGTNEAIAHCRHILRTFPKHLETYRLLGKSYLESHRYGEAVDVFSRVLMSVPDDFVSHVGMSIINDEQNRLDDSIWHMERAFESQPSNPAIQGELQRLYGRRDGMEPPKVRMTRGALAHMYVQGELYPQAIAEVRAVLGQDAQRADMQVLLARAYFKSGQKADAADVCVQLLQRYPYCFDGNRIMMELLPAGGAAESPEAYRSRAAELDPYVAHAKGSAFQSNEVADAAVTLERLQYTGDEVSMGQEWSSGLGIGLSASSAPALAATSSAGDQPDWLKGFSSEAGGSADPFASVPAAQPQEDIPDFMRSAGWGASSGPEQPVSFFDSPEPASGGALAPADIPDWLKGQAPSEPAPAFGSIENDLTPAQPAETPDWLGGLGGGQFTESSPAPSNETPDWLGGLGGAQAAQPSEPAPAPSNDAPDWLSGLDGGQFTEPASAASNDAPDWLSGLGAQAGQSAGTAGTEAPDWLSSLGGDQQQAAVPLGSFQDSEPARPPSAPDWLAARGNEPADDPSTARLAEPSATPDWLKGLGGPPSTPTPSIESLGASAQEQDDAVAWLESLAAKHGAKPEELVTDPNKRSDTPPEWVEQARSASQSQPAASIENLGATAQEQDDAVAWLESLAAKHGAKPEELVTDPNKRSDTPPEWVEQARSASQSQPVASIESLGASAQEQDDAVAWLESLAAKHGAKPEELVTDPNKRSDTPPEWVEQARFAAESQSAQPNQWSETAQNIGEQFFSEFEDASPSTPTADETGMWLKGQEEKEKQEQTAGDAADWMTAPADQEKDRDVPDWMSNKKESAGGFEVPAERSDLPDWLGGMNDASAGDEYTPRVEHLSRGDLSDWLSGLDEQPAAELEPSAPSVPRGDLPDWLSGVDAENEKAKDDWNTGSVQQESAPTSEETDEPVPASMGADLPGWLQGVDEESQQDGELGSDLPLKPTSPSDWHPVETAPQSPRKADLGSRPPMPKPKPSAAPPSREPVYEPIEKQEQWAAEPPPVIETRKPIMSPPPSSPRQPVAAPVAQSVAQSQPVAQAQASKPAPAKKSGMRASETQPGSSALVQAKEELDRGDIPAALDHYGKLIKKGKHLEETIRDLNESIYRYPVEVSIWQTLGDAYMRANRLKEALEAYNKAEELIR